MRMSTDTDLTQLAETLGRELAATGQVLATAESCTGGWISKVVTEIPGSSEWFGSGYVTYANASKTRMLGVPATLLATHGAVSAEVAAAMAEGALAAARADIAVAVSGIAGPGGGTPEKPVGTVCFAWATPAGTRTLCKHFDGDRDAVRRQTVAEALEGLLAVLYEEL